MYKGTELAAARNDIASMIPSRVAALISYASSWVPRSCLPPRPRGAGARPPSVPPGGVRRPPWPPSSPSSGGCAQPSGRCSCRPSLPPSVGLPLVPLAREGVPYHDKPRTGPAGRALALGHLLRVLVRARQELEEPVADLRLRTIGGAMRRRNQIPNSGGVECATLTVLRSRRSTRGRPRRSRRRRSPGPPEGGRSAA